MNRSFLCLSSRFTEVLQNIRKRHTSVVETLAQVIWRDFFGYCEEKKDNCRDIWSFRKWDK